MPPVNIGTGFCKFVEAEPDALEDATLIAEIVTVAEAGIVAGAVYKPVVAIVPDAAFPATTPFTSHVTFWFVVLLTVAINLVLAPSRTLEAPATLTVTFGLVEVPVVPLEQPVKNPSNVAEASKKPTRTRRSGVFMGPSTLTPISAATSRAPIVSGRHLSKPRTGTLLRRF